jgi:hypothetical protein
VLTQEAYQDRILGLSETRKVPTNVTFIATGNNLSFRGDITRRVVLCTMDAGLERPDERRFSRNLYKYVPAHRGPIINAALTTLRGIPPAGRPDMGIAALWRVLTSERIGVRAFSGVVWVR